MINQLVSRIQATSEVNKLAIELDINTEIYPVNKGEFYKLFIASSVNSDGSENFDIIRYENEGSASGMGSLIDQYDYVMHGKVFKYQLEEKDDKKTTNAFISFGGLLMSIKGEHKTQIKNLEIDSRVYLLMSKI